MGDIRVVCHMKDHGWPDEGHWEWYLVDATPRKNKFLQWFLGDKEEKLVYYGGARPEDKQVKKDIKTYENRLKAFHQ
jgi:hypothetical protein